MKAASILLLLALLAAAPAQEEVEPPLPVAEPERALQPAPSIPKEAEPTDPKAALSAITKGDRDAEKFATLLPLLADPAQRNALRTSLLTLKPFPAEALAGLLDDSRLAVRLGALELLEEKAGGDFGFNPWAAPAAPENEGPLARWRQWSGTPDQAAEGKPLLGDEQRNGYLRDLLGQDADKSARARRMLEADGPAAVGFLESFLASSPALPAGSRSRVREAQYQIVLSRPLGPQAAATARQLAFGNRDQMLSALGALKGLGFPGLPILADFIRHPDPLVRETAIDAMLAAGGAETLPVVGPALMEERDVNVIHGAMRRLKDVPGNASLKLVAGFLSHEDEDLLVSAIQTCLKLSGGGNSSHNPFSSGRSATSGKEETSNVTPAILKSLSDPRWRVRTAALEYVAGRQVGSAKDEVIRLLSDPDEFVRFSAIKAATAIGANEALEKLKGMFLADPGMVGPVLQGYAEMKRSPDREMQEKLATYPPDAKLAAIQAAVASESLHDIASAFANDPDKDVACAAIRFLSADESRVKRDDVASILVAALRSGDPERQAAALDRLDLPKAETNSSGEEEAVVETVRAPTSLDPLYDAFLQTASALAGQKRVQEPGVAILPGAQEALFQSVAGIAAGEGPQSFRAALCLAKANRQEGFKELLKRLPSLSTAQKAAIGDQVYSPTANGAFDLLRQLLRDPVTEIRSAAAEAALSNENSTVLIRMALDELSRPGAALQPYELYNYRFTYATRQSKSAKTFRAWAGSVLKAPDSSDPTTILALIALSHGTGDQSDRTLELAISSPNPWVRRAAWYALGQGGSSLFRQNLAKLAADPAPRVRAVLPECAGRMDSGWSHRFDDVHESDDHSYSSDRDRRKLDDTLLKALQAMASTDPAPENRFEANFALLSHGKPIDVDAFAALVPRQPKEAYAGHRLGSWMSENLARLGPGLAPLLSAIGGEDMDSEKLQTVAKRILPQARSGGITSFAALAAAAAGNPDTGKPAQQVVAEEPGAVIGHQSERQSLKLIFFFKPGCQECARVSRMFDTLKGDFSGLVVEEHNLLESRGTLLNQALCARFEVPSAKHTIAPSVFTQGGFLVRDDIVPQALGKLLTATQALPEDDSWSTIAEPEVAAAREQVEQRYHALTLPVVLFAGLLDGVNPCAFATIIFFLSYLQIARRTPREMLMVGAAFILAVFLAYLAAGLVLHKVLAGLTTHIAGIQKWLNWVFGGLSLIAAWLSFRDAIRARRGNPEDMTLQLPAFLKDRIRGVIRTGARARRFVIAAFLAGIVISFLELACTGQVYAPIVYQIQQGRSDAVAWLVAYNLAFIAPLVVIFLLAWSGLRSEALIGFQKRYTAAVKVALGLLFLVLAAFILFGERLLHG